MLNLAILITAATLNLSTPALARPGTHPPCAGPATEAGRPAERAPGPDVSPPAVCAIDPDRIGRQ